ncbi:HEPN domain-containing protein [Granulicella mallensis]|uniref:Apea-like HEPN domain-containing protein n=1 Tax=Granulicella mallensis TaxID=940614 RepID=A0A7W7ZVB0_9BACT|nr:HEPN domain-containing protein [Granulicella mallensis]MBB5066775.1 hypothetical protein [Granulicella mallensis]
MKNPARVQQLFSGMANAFAACVAGAASSTLNVDLSRHAHIQYGEFVFPQAFALKLFEVSNLAAEQLDADSAWSKEALFDLLIRHSIEIARGNVSQAGVTGVAAKFLKELKRQPSEYEKQIAIFGLDGFAEPMEFGQIELIGLNHTPPSDHGSLFIGGNPTRTEFASVRVIAIDDQTAQAKTKQLLASHLAVLNALCAEAWPSYYRLSDSYIDPMDFRMIGTVLPSGEWGGSMTRVRSVYPLPSVKLRSIIESERSKRASALMTSKDEVSRRIRAGYELAGKACSTVDPATAFVLFTIALESSVMGGTSTEITHQLAMRVAHLVSNSVSERAATARLVKDLYKTRSKIVHRGETDITSREVNQIRILCLDSLRELAALAERDCMTQNAEFTRWFEMRQLQ